MHICYISQEYPPETGWGGVGTYTYIMARDLVKRGHRVTIISVTMSEPSIESQDGVEVHRLNEKLFLDGVRGSWRLQHYFPGFAWAAAECLYRLHCIVPVDVVEYAEVRADGFFTALQSYFSKRTTPATVVRLHMAWRLIDQLNKIKPTNGKRLKYWLEKQSILKSDLITAPSQAVLNWTLKWLPQLQEHNPIVLANPIDVAPFHQSKTQAEDGKEILFVGRLEKRKGLDALVKAVPKVLKVVPDAHFRFVGRDGVDEQGTSWRQRIEDAALPYGVNCVQFTHVPRVEMPKIYQSASVSVFPSTWENFPYVVLESMACGTPVIVSSTGGMPEIVEDEDCGLIVDPDNPDQLAQAILRLLRNPDLSHSLGLKGKTHVVHRFSTDEIVPKMIELYKQAASQRS